MFGFGKTKEQKKLEQVAAQIGLLADAFQKAEALSQVLENSSDKVSDDTYLAIIHGFAHQIVVNAFAHLGDRDVGIEEATKNRALRLYMDNGTGEDIEFYHLCRVVDRPKHRQYSDLAVQAAAEIFASGNQMLVLKSLVEKCLAEKISWKQWLLEFKRSAARTNKTDLPLDVNDQGLIDFMDHTPLKRAFNDSVDPVQLGVDFAKQFDINTLLHLGK